MNNFLMATLSLINKGNTLSSFRTVLCFSHILNLMYNYVVLKMRKNTKKKVSAFKQMFKQKRRKTKEK